MGIDRIARGARCALRRRVFAAALTVGLTLGLTVGLAPFAHGQWERLDKSAPNVLELVAATNFILERWPTAASHYEMLLQAQPSNDLALLFAVHSLRELGELERALVLGEPGLERPSVRAPLALELARCAAQLANEGQALGFLVEAKRSQLVAPKRWLEGLEELRPLRREPEFKALAAECEEVAERFARLAAAGDSDGLRALWLANAVGYWEDIGRTTWLLQEVVDERHEALERGREAAAEGLARQLELGAAAADEALGCVFYVPWIQRALAWSKDERREREELWKRYQRLDGSIRAHRFGAVLESLDELDAIAERLGDAPARYIIDRTRGLVHCGILNYDQPRRGISRAEEYRLGRAAFLRFLELSRAIRDVEGLVDGYDFLASFEIEVPELSLPEAEQLIFGGMIATARFEPEAREFGMFENMWRELQEHADRKAEGAGSRD